MLDAALSAPPQQGEGEGSRERTADEQVAFNRALTRGRKVVAELAAPTRQDGEGEESGLRKAAINAIALLDVAIAGTVFTQPNRGRVVVNIAKAQAVLDGLRAAVASQPSVKI